MWIMLSDAFISIVKKDCGDDELLVRARRAGDIQRVFGARVRVQRATDADYLYRAVVSRDDVQEAIDHQIGGINYPNFKMSVKDKPLHDAYLSVWHDMVKLQRPAPYSTPYNRGRRA